MPPSLAQLAHSLLLDGEEIKRSHTTLSSYYRRLGRPPSTIATATSGLGMSRSADRVRALVTPPLALGPSAGLVLGVALGTETIRAALVDANGWHHAPHRGANMAGQLAASPDALFDRIGDACKHVIEDALKKPELLVRDRLPFLGIAVAWPAPLNREKQPRGALTHSVWRSNMLGIHHRLAKRLDIPRNRSHAVNDAAAAALAVAFDQTREPAYKDQRAELVLVVRISGGIGAATIAVEPQTNRMSGWMKSSLTGGYNGLAGEFGHTPVSPSVVEGRDADRPDGCPELMTVPCSCARPGESPPHLEAFASTRALAARFRRSPDEPDAQVVRRVVAQRSDPVHRHALQDVGALIGDALVSSILMLNPRSIILTGRLALEEVKQGAEDHLERFEPFGRIFGASPEIHVVSGERGDYAGVRGAALAVLREHVHRRVDYLYGAKQVDLADRFEELTQPVERWPVGDLSWPPF